jgi:hypothetical protein
LPHRPSVVSVSWNLRRVIRVLWRFNARSEGNLDVVVTNETANIPLSNGCNFMYSCSVFVKILFSKYSDNLCALCIYTGGKKEISVTQTRETDCNLLLKVENLKIQKKDAILYRYFPQPIKKLTWILPQLR